MISVSVWVVRYARLMSVLAVAIVVYHHANARIFAVVTGMVFGVAQVKTSNLKSTGNQLFSSMQTN